MAEAADQDDAHQFEARPLPGASHDDEGQVVVGSEQCVYKSDGGGGEDEGAEFGGHGWLSIEIVDC